MRVHFIGIGGIGLSALARFLQYRGYKVSGSDVKSTPITKELEKEGIVVNIPQCPSAIQGQDLIIYSAAVLNDNVEIQEAKKQELVLLPRKEALSVIMQKTTNYCICAAHGKSTTTAILSSILQSSAIIGAISKEFDSNFRYIDEVLAFEADESDESFILSHPYCSIVLNTEPEHMEYYNYDEKRFYDAYTKFLDIAKLRVINAEDEFLQNYKGYAIRLYPSKDINNIEFVLKDDEPYTKFLLKDFGEFEVWGFGVHIAIDAACAILAASQTMEVDAIKENLAKYKGIKKRFDIVQKSENLIVIDDYAHHPTEIKATLESVNLYNKYKKLDKKIVIWQPHKYSRTMDNLEAFKECFKGCDELIILPVWTVAEEIREIDFAKEFAHYNTTLCTKISTSNGKIELLNEQDEIIRIIKTGIVLGVGAGDITYQLRH
ncbi:UDP-N-acetylmuramate--L-alanine ligase [Arcobacter sp. 15-2]|uniref:UDP-N-acetylmuramate--L-alanine ligase n=1 Tax=Arcobacter sp. 15-2 TaxID=3374109 RepID=UPI00399CD097